MTDSQSGLMEAFDRLADQFAQTAASDIQMDLQQTMGRWRSPSSGRSNAVGLSMLADTRQIRPANEPSATASGPFAENRGHNGLAMALAQRLATLLPLPFNRISAGSESTPPALPSTPGPAKSLNSGIFTNGISRFLRQAGSANPATLPTSGRHDSLGIAQSMPSLSQASSSTAQQLARWVNRLLSGNGKGFESTWQSPGTATSVSDERQGPVAAQIQQLPTTPARSAFHSGSSRAFDRLQDAARQQLDRGESLVPFRGDLALGTVGKTAGDRLPYVSATTAGDRTVRSARQSSSNHDDGANTASTNSPAAMSMPPLAAPIDASTNLHQSAWSTVYSLKADARWNDQPTDVLKPLR